MLSASSDIQKEPVLVVQDGNKFYSRLLSKESSVANPSFRVYYGVASGSVPFLWESQPGTPKHISSGTAIPPLTPPPSYYSTTRSKNSKLKTSKSLNLIRTILPRLSLSLRKNAHATSPSSPSSGSLSSTSSVSSSSSFSSAASARRRCRRSSGTGLSFSSSRAEDEESDAVSSTSTPLCFGRGIGRSYSVGLMKIVWQSIAGSHGSRHGAAAA